MAPQPLIDSHIHLWPQSASNASGHGWMQPGHHLTRQYSIEDYLTASNTPNVDVKGFVYVETDRKLGEGSQLSQYAEQPLEEIKFLRRIVEGQGNSEGNRVEHAPLMRGAVAWAPIDRGLAAFEEYLAEAEKVAGPETWKKIKGFRYLLQGIHDQEKFTKLALGDETIQILKEFKSKAKGRDFVFDVGVDQRQGGIWQLEQAVSMIEAVHMGVREEDKVTFILNHLCKPDLEHTPETAEQKDAFYRYLACIERFSKQSKVYMKLSGGFSEIGDQDPSAPWPAEKVVERMKPWLDVLFRFFPPERIMFGSNWPVDNVRGPGEEHAWRSWQAVVARILEEYHLSDEAKNRIWYGTAIEAYTLDPI